MPPALKSRISSGNPVDLPDGGVQGEWTRARPALSICIPTYNRADLLDYCLDNLRGLEELGLDFEVVVSDNASTDDTPKVLQRHVQTLPRLRHYRQPRNVDVESNLLNAMRNAYGETMIYLADDDSILPEALAAHVDRLLREPDLAAIYADWIAYDDEREVELHRYFRDVPQPVDFAPDDPLAIVNFVLQHIIYPEAGVYRREVFLQSHCFTKYGKFPFYLWLYRMSRMGRIAFDPKPYYREHRVLKPRFRREQWTNMAVAMQLIGDELRCALESMTLWAMQDAGAVQVPDSQVLIVKQMIDRFLHARIALEVDRALRRKDWILAAELRRRAVLWHGPGTSEEQNRDALQIAMPAAFQAICQYYRSLSDVSGVVLLGFHSRHVHDFLREHFPEVAVIEPDASAASAGRALVVFRETPADEPPGPRVPPGYRLYLDRLLQNYHINHLQIDVSSL